MYEKQGSSPNKNFKKNQINKNPLPKKKANRKKTNPNSKYS